MKKVIALILLSVISANAQETIKFTNTADVLAYATQNSITLKSGNAQIALTKFQTYYTKINRLNPRANVGYSITDNFQLPVNFLPAEVFGGTAGTFKEAKLGQQYIQNLNIMPQIDLINHAAWAKLQSAKTNEQLAEINTVFIRKTLSESVIAVYFSIASNQQQLLLLKKTYQNADSVLKIVENKFNQGIIRGQDVNTAKVNKLLIQDRIQQTQNNIEQQHNLLKSLCDAPTTTTLVVEHENTSNGQETKVILPNTLKAQQAELQIKYAQNELKVSQLGYYPTLSLMGGWALQENSNNHFFDGNARWIPISYVGLRLNYAIPDANKNSQNKVVKTNLAVAQLNNQKQLLQQDFEQKQLQLEYQKAIENEKLTKEILTLKSDTYQKNLNLFKQDIYPTENLILSFMDELNATLNQTVAKVNIEFQNAKININNTLK
jgi:outer membrane protein TolC